MKKLFLTVAVVAIAFVGFIAILCVLPCNNGGCGMKDKCEMMGDGHGKCSGEKGMCDGKENCEEKVWTDADGKVHKEVKVIIGGEGDMGGACSGHGKCQMNMGKCDMDSMMGGKCEMGGMKDGKCKMDGGMKEGCEMGGGMSGGCCCCKMMMMMMNGGHCNMEENMVDSPKVKVRGKL